MPNAGVEDRRAQIASLRHVVRERFPRAARGQVPRLLPSGAAVWPTGQVDLDDRLPDRGVPRVGITELTEAPGARRTSMLLGLVAGLTSRGIAVAWVDAFRSFSPMSAEVAGVALDNVLWIRPSQPGDALIAAEAVVPHFAMTVLDWGFSPLVPSATAVRPPAQVWYRLRQRCSATRHAMVVMAPYDGSSLVAGAAVLRIGVGPRAVPWMSTGSEGFDHGADRLRIPA